MANPIPTTHHWTWCLEVENDYRNSHCKIEHRWFSHLAFFFEASWTAGLAPTKSDADQKIHVILNRQEIGAYRAKEEAVGIIRKLIHDAPPSCRNYSMLESWVISDCVFGVGSSLIYPKEA